MKGFKVAPKGFYYRDGKLRKGIVIKRPGLYGSGFMSRPKAARFAKIRAEERKEGPKRVDEQMAAMRSFTYRNPKLSKVGEQDLKYAESLK